MAAALARGWARASLRPASMLFTDSGSGRAESLAAEVGGHRLGSLEDLADRADLVIVCDLEAWRRGHAHDGEPCHIIGGGPIPVSLAKELGQDAFLKAVLHTGTELHTIAHFGRRWPAKLRTALELGVT